LSVIIVVGPTVRLQLGRRLLVTGEARSIDKSALRQAGRQALGTVSDS